MTAVREDPRVEPPAATADVPPRATAAEGLRFAFGTLTVLPVRVERWDRGAGAAGMLCAPAAGAVVGVAAGALGAVVAWLGGGPLLASVATVAVPAALTRGLHLDGLADTADGLGSGKPAEDALRVMKQSDIGPFGVLTLVLALLAQVAALTDGYARGWTHGALAAVVAALTGRAAMTLACRRGVPPARRDGLGAVVADAVPRNAAATVTALVVVVAGALGATLSPGAAVHQAVAVLLGLTAAHLLCRRCVSRLGGVTGDVFGALCETAVTAALLALALG
ncbi:adenosylcobinamide-GDP ribazoletransferase [Streptantibioticus parmotrematis]|uniref:adenosylcobinamide-GDP ribazoletransferase n=1 Tax=Streptantibioticus parmotrematis TaxID=2873249 RepID=UPI0033EA1089